MKKCIVSCFIALFSLSLATLSAATPSEVPEPAKKQEMQFICKLVSNGLSGNALQPRLAIDKAVNIANGEELSDVQYYYTMSTVSFKDAGNPDNEDPQVPEDGIQIVPESTRPEGYLKIPPFGTWYVVILAEADGYNNCYAQVKVQNWQFGKKYDTIDGTAFVNEKSTRDFPKNYHGLQFSHFAYTRQVLLNKISVTPGNTVSVPVKAEGYAMLYMKGDSPKGCVVSFLHNGEETDSYPVMCTAANATAITSSVYKVKPGDKVSLRPSEYTVQVYDIAIMEQK